MAKQEGGAIRYNYRRPDMSNNRFHNNTAQYGDNISSYAVRVVKCEEKDNNIEFTNQGSGLYLDNDLELCLIDYDNQTMVLSNSAQIKMSATTEDAGVVGIDNGKTTSGKSTFGQLGFTHKPGSERIRFKMTATEIDTEKVSHLDLPTDDSITVSFRFCQPGEVIDSMTRCRKCSAGTYSFTWNSTECYNCMDNAVWLGESEVVVEDEYWRDSLNSTKILSCPRTKSCKGGYVPLNEHPVEWEEGYSSYMWAKWIVNDKVKYNRVSTYQCAKCPDVAFNAIRVIGVILLAFLFLTVLVIVAIRKRKENQTSILLRIMTNYLQLISAALSFNLRFPNTISSLFSPIDNVGSASDTFLSFDCFFEDTEMKGFAPNTEILKVFLAGVLPLILIGIYAIVWSVLYLVNKRLFGNFKRNLIISSVCIIFLLHTTITKSSLSMFEWLEVDESNHRMRVNMDYECFSGKHVGWLFAAGVPNIIVWVIGAPVLSFVVLYRRRASLDDESVKQYFLMLYQGYRYETFYWEFVNTIRKFMILALNTIFSFIPITYRVLLSITFLISVIRVQQKAQPYRLNTNNSIEIRATTAGIMTLYSGILFQEDEDGDFSWVVILAFIFLILLNVIFIIEWGYLVLVSLNSKRKVILALITIYEFIL